MMSNAAARTSTQIVLAVGIVIGICIAMIGRLVFTSECEHCVPCPRAPECPPCARPAAAPAVVAAPARCPKSTVAESPADVVRHLTTIAAAAADPTPAEPEAKFVASRFPVRGSKIERSLDNLVAKTGDSSARSDKFRVHDYGPMYEKALAPYMLDKTTPFKFFEIGLGCFDWNNFNGGPGYRFIKHYAPHADYFGLDINPCNFSHLTSADVEYLADRFVRGSQVDPAALATATRKAGGYFDFIIDDGSHMSDHMIATFLNLFQNSLRPGGVYCIEDLSTAFINMGGHPRSAQASRRTSVNFMQDLMGQLQFPWHWLDGDVMHRALKPSIHPDATFPITKLAAMIRSIDCDREICCITKMDNAPDAKHRFAVPCHDDICEIPSRYVRA